MSDLPPLPIKPSEMLAFREALEGGRGELDAWLECNNEAEVRAYIRAYVSAAVAAERAACAKACEEAGSRQVELRDETPWNVCTILAAAIRARDGA
jgi:hypothetical protein